MSESIIEALKSLGAYEHVRAAVDSDEELIRLYVEDFPSLLERVLNYSAASVRGERPMERR